MPELLPEGVLEDGTAVCSGCGVIHDGATEYIQRLVEQRELLERELRAKRSQIKRLRVDQYAQLVASPHYAAGCRVLEEWKSICAPSAREPTSADRLAPTIDRLKGGFTEEQLIRCAYGYSLKPFVVNGVRTHDGPKDNWHADPELIYRSPKHVQKGLAIADQADALQEGISGKSNGHESPDGAVASVIGQAALRLARLGFFVFPVAARGKEPVTPHGLKDAKRDEGPIISTWTRYPDLNLAVRTGAESGVVVLDVDGEIGFESLQELEGDNEALPTTASVKTPRGGSHFYFRHPGREVRNSAGLLGPGLDIRGDGGYVLAPPSVGANGRCYEPDEQAPIAPMPGWLVETLVKRQERLDQALAGGELETFMQEGAAPGNRNDRLARLAGHLLSHRHTPQDTASIAFAMNRSYCNPPLTNREVEKIVKSIIRTRARSAS